MKIQLLSDLHLEAHPNWLAEPAAGADLLVLAGDIGSYQKGSGLRDTDFGLGQFSPKSGWPTPVVFVPGNHEYDALDFDATHLRLQETCERLGIQWLERRTLLPNTVDLHGRPVRLIGTTLWTDFDALAPTDTSAQALTQQLKARDKAFRAANYYLRKTDTTRDDTLFLAEQMRQLGLQCQAWLREALLTPFDGVTIVVTHFAPSLQSADPRYGMTPGTAGFCNALDDLLQHANLWLHGHLHCPSDYVHRGCRVVANPLGYARKNEQSLFRPTGLIEI
ncbi:MAG: metallophosphoesterase [Rhodoferax sp.]|nr:metallophosphoesterase [Rhodoferax sp.]